MGLNEENRKVLVDLYWEKATQTYLDAEWAISAKKWNVAANRIYYAAFHAVTALFIKDGFAVSSHRGSKAALGQRYVLTGKLSSQDGKLYAQLSTPSSSKNSLTSKWRIRYGAHLAECIS